jgi:hypothetical protein
MSDGHGSESETIAAYPNANDAGTPNVAMLKKERSI